VLEQMADGVEEVWPTIHITECYSWQCVGLLLAQG